MDLLEKLQEMTKDVPPTIPEAISEAVGAAYRLRRTSPPAEIAKAREALQAVQRRAMTMLLGNPTACDDDGPFQVFSDPVCALEFLRSKAPELKRARDYLNGIALAQPQVLAPVIDLGAVRRVVAGVRRRDASIRSLSAKKAVQE